VLYFVIPFTIAIVIMGTRELWLNVVRPWQERRKTESNETGSNASASDNVTPLQRRVKTRVTQN
jgi:hypothetical protein